MSTDYPPVPSDQARIQALERLIVTLNARIEQLSIQMNQGFHQAYVFQDERFTKIEEELASMKGEILSAFNALLTMVDARLPKKDN
jgi:TolA-binding protein